MVARGLTMIAAICHISRLLTQVLAPSPQNGLLIGRGHQGRWVIVLLMILLHVRRLMILLRYSSAARAGRQSIVIVLCRLVMCVCWILAGAVWMISHITSVLRTILVARYSFSTNSSVPCAWRWRGGGTMIVAWILRLHASCLILQLLRQTVIGKNSCNIIIVLGWWWSSSPSGSRQYIWIELLLEWLKNFS